MANRPNVLVLFTDQQRFDTIHALGNPIIQTPNLDRLCAQGVSFTSSYSPSPVCVPARASLHYGRYPANTGCCDNCDPMPTGPSFMQVLMDAGYRTHGIGKCHFTPDRGALRGFQTREIQEEIPAFDDAQDYKLYLRECGYGDLAEPHGSRGEMYYIPQNSQLPARSHPSQWIGDRSVAFLQERENQDAPWMLFSSFIHPHPPFCPPSPWHRLYRPDLMPDPKIPDDWPFLQTTINRIQNGYKIRDSGWNRHLARCIKAYYYACIGFVDFQIGRILDELEKTGQLANTLILFSSDHGELLGDYRCFGKRSMHDSCARIPLIARFPDGFGAGSACDRPASLIDIAPTILQAAGIPATAMALDGVDLRALADGTSKRDMVYAQFNRGAEAIYTAVSQRWKYAYSAADDQEFLFDRELDPTELRSVAAFPPYAHIRASLAQATQNWLASCEDQEVTAAALDAGPWKKHPKTAHAPADPAAGKILQDPEGMEACMRAQIGEEYLQALFRDSI